MRTGVIVIVILCLASPAVRAQDGAAPPAGDGADSPHELDEIVVTTAGRRAQSRSDAVVATEVIDRETLRDNGAENVAEAL